MFAEATKSLPVVQQYAARGVMALEVSTFGDVLGADRLATLRGKCDARNMFPPRLASHLRQPNERFTGLLEVQRCVYTARATRVSPDVCLWTSVPLGELLLRWPSATRN